MSLSKFICNIVDIMKTWYYSKPEIDAKVDSLNNAKANINHTHNSLTSVSIPEGSDLNDYTEQGTYRCSQNSIVASLSNCPTNLAFHLEIYLHVGVMQVLMTHDINNPEIFVRNYYSPLDDWGSWFKLELINS